MDGGYDSVSLNKAKHVYYNPTAKKHMKVQFQVRYVVLFKAPPALTYLSLIVLFCARQGRREREWPYLQR